MTFCILSHPVILSSLKSYPNPNDNDDDDDDDDDNNNNNNNNDKNLYSTVS